MNAERWNIHVFRIPLSAGSSPLSIEENALQSTKNNNAPAYDNIVAEMLKAFPKDIFTFICIK